MSRIVVAGGANIDIDGRPVNPLRPKVSNPGSVQFVPGGVGRNIAHNLSLLGHEVHLVTAFGGDANAQLLEQSCREAGLHIEQSGRFPQLHSSCFLSVENPEGEMQVAIADLGIYDHMDPAFWSERRALLDSANACVLDTNLTEEALDYITRHARAPLFLDPVSAARSVRALPLLPRLFAIKPNQYEATQMCGIAIAGPRDALRAARELCRMGARRVFLTLGADGVACASANESFLLRVPPVRIVRDTGAGDAFMAGILHSALRGEDLYRNAVSGAVCSALSLGCAETVCSRLSADVLASERAKQFDSFHKEENPT